MYASQISALFLVNAIHLENIEAAVHCNKDGWTELLNAAKQHTPVSGEMRLLRATLLWLMNCCGE